MGRIVYNVTVKVDNEVHDDWKAWMLEVHIPDVMKTAIFSEYRMLEVLDGMDDGRTYAIQYTTETQERLDLYHEKHAPALQAEHTARYKDKFVAFRTILEEVATN